jgi:DNA-binding SARP family transcriptional activator
VHVDQHRLTLRPSAQRVLALLAVRGDLNRVDAAGRLWPDVLQSRAHANLRTVLWRVRQDAPGFVCEDGDVLALPEGIDVDLFRLREWAWRALRGEEPWMPAPHCAGQELLPGWGDDWLVQPREELRLLHLYALETAAQRLLMAGHHGEACGFAAAAVNIDPLRESSNRLLIEIHLSDGNRLDALRQFDTYARLLRRETDTEPSPGLTALLEAAASGQHSTVGFRREANVAKGPGTTALRREGRAANLGRRPTTLS